MLKTNETFISHTVDSRWNKLTVFSHTALKKFSNRSEFLSSFLFSFHKMTLIGTVSHEFELQEYKT